MIPAIVLAAGGSTRMGQPKALLTIGAGGQTFLNRILRTLDAAGIDEVIVVLGSEAGLVEQTTIASPRVRFVENPQPERGQLSSLLEGLRIADRPGVQAVIVTLVDVPLVEAATVRKLVDAYRKAGAPITRPVSGIRHGHPVIFDRAVFDEIRRADETIGVKSVLRAHVGGILEVPVTDEGAFSDIDTPEDYARLVPRP
jgi:CTP:molybdopterin cytidylyltransferase MocA